MGSHLHFFTIPANAGTAEQDALNVFLASNRVVALEKQWISAGAESAWAICVTVASGQAIIA